MRSIETLLGHPLAGSAIRYGIAGAIVAGFYLGLPLVLTGPLGVPIQVAIPIAYFLAITLHFNLQRRFVFRHVEQFALPVRDQIGRYAAIAAVQYPTTALAIALLPKLLGISERVVFVGVTVCISIAFFLILRGRVFHPSGDEEPPVRSAPRSRTPEHGVEAEAATGERSGQHDPVRS